MNLSCFFKPACQKTFKTHRPNNKAFSLVELLTVIGIIGVLSLIAVPSYLKQKRRSYEAWMADVLTEQSTFLELAYSIDGAYHQYLTDMGWRPHGKQLGQVGFRLMGNRPPCCNTYPNPNTASEAAFQHFTYIKQNPGGKNNTAAGTRTRWACSGMYSDTCNTDFVGAIPLGPFSRVEIQEQAPCTYTIKDATCDCNEFTLMGITNYERTTDKNNKVSKGAGVLVLNHNGMLCRAGDNDKVLQPYSKRE